MAFTCLGLSKEYATVRGATSALDDVSLRVADNEFVCVVGPSGCGKTTLLKVIAGLVRPTSGVVSFDGGAGDRPPATLVFQEHGVYDWMRVVDNVAFGLEALGVPRNERRNRAGALIDRMGLGDFADAYPYELSVGMRQRVGIARAFLTGSRNLLMDEPFGSLDAQTKLVLQQDLLRLWEENRTSVLYVTHDVEEAVALGDRVIVMTGRPGRIRETIEVSRPRPRSIGPGIDGGAQPEAHVWTLLAEEARAQIEGRGTAEPSLHKRASKRRVPEWWPAPAFIVAVLGLWEAASRAGLISKLYFPPPSVIWTTLRGLVAHTGLLHDARLTALRLAVGLVLGFPLALCLGWIMGWSRRTRAAIDPLVAAVHPLPKIALLPLIMVVFGIGELSKVIAIAVGVFFPLVITATTGVKQISGINFDVARNLGLTRLRTFVRVVVPGSLPVVMAGVRVAVNIGVLVTIAVELLAANRGLGARLWLGWETFRPEQIWAILVVLAAGGIAVNAVVLWLTRVLVPWRPDAEP